MGGIPFRFRVRMGWYEQSTILSVHACLDRGAQQIASHDATLAHHLLLFYVLFVLCGVAGESTLGFEITHYPNVHFSAGPMTGQDFDHDTHTKKA